MGGTWIVFDDLEPELLKLAHKSPQAPFVLYPRPVLGDLLGAEHPAHRLGPDLAGPVPVGPVQLRGIVMAMASGVSAGEAAFAETAGEDEAHLCDLFRDASRLGLLPRAR